MAEDKVLISQIETEGLQVRVQLNQTAVAEYRTLIESGNPMDPVKLVHEGETYYLWDGFHRLEAYTGLGKKKIPAIVEEGTRSEAVDKALSANARHGVRRSSEDKRNAITMAMELYPDMTDTAVAELCDVNRKTVALVREEKEGKRRPKLDIAKDALLDTTNEGLTVQKISAKIGIARSTIAQAADELGIELKTEKKAVEKFSEDKQLNVISTLYGKLDRAIDDYFRGMKMLGSGEYRDVQDVLDALWESFFEPKDDEEELPI